MFWNLKRRKSLISVTNLNDVYANTINDMATALGNRGAGIIRKKLGRRIFVIDF